MEQRAQRYVRRRRGWLGQVTESAEPGASPLDTPGDVGQLRRRRGPHFGERMAATRELLGYTADDESRIAATSHLLAPHCEEIAAEIYRGLLAHPETAAQFHDANGVTDRADVALQQEAFQEWLLSVICDPLDATTASYLATVAHSYVRRERPEGRIKARFLLTTIARVQALFVAILADALPDSKELGACVRAWSRQLAVHLDLMLAVYGSTEGSAHWY